METEYMIDIREFCSFHDIEMSFVSSLNQSGLIELKKVNDEEFIEICAVTAVGEIYSFVL